MSRPLSFPRQLGIAARWPLGVALTSWRYLWRTTPLHRSEYEGSLPLDACPALPAGVEPAGIQRPEDGEGPLFHRLYSTRVRTPRLSARGLMARIQAEPDAGSPSEFATFRKTRGEAGQMRLGDEYVVRMAGPWDGPVRVIDVSDATFRLATLDGHLEAGQIEFSAAPLGDGEVEFRIESWARSGDALSNLLYTHLRMAKEIQFHMWTSFLEHVADLAGGRMTGGIHADTRRVEDPQHAR